MLLYNHAEADRVNRFILRDHICFLLHSRAGSHSLNVRGGTGLRKSRVVQKNWWLRGEWRYIVTARLWNAFTLTTARCIKRVSFEIIMHIYLTSFPLIPLSVHVHKKYNANLIIVCK